MAVLGSDIAIQTHSGTAAAFPNLSATALLSTAWRYSSSTSGTSNRCFGGVRRAAQLPSNSHHVWTSARPFSSTRSEPDIGIKQAWVQGSFMRALAPEVVEEALKVQEALLGTGFDCVSYADEGPISSMMYEKESSNSEGNNSRSTLLAAPGMFFHSPLLYWNCSISAIRNDPNLIDTINKNYYRHSPANVTLRWGSVFAGKRFSHRRLAEADALVISLFYRLDGGMGELWDQRAQLLAEEAQQHKRYDVYPSDGKEKNTTLYEFRFQPMSTLDNLLLAGCYFLTFAYLVVSLRRLRAVKSRLGLVLTVLTQIAASIISSFTILAFLKVPVSHIPREVFPFVVIVIGLENMFRLINAVLETPAEQPTSLRIATALGEVGFLSTVAVGTDLAILIIIGHFSVPAVREFCSFAAVALIMDFVLHLTYFLAVLSVDVRRLELQDSLDRLNLSTEKTKWTRNDSPEGQNKLTEFLLHGAMPVSTRIAGSAIMICFLVALNMHFLENQSPLRTISTLLDIVSNPQSINKRSLARAPIMPVNVARTPTSWLKLQDQLTGMELIRAVKPGAHLVIAKAYNPLFVVLKGSNRARSDRSFELFSSLFDVDTIKKHMQAFVLTIVVVVAGVTLLMNHLLMKGMPEDLSDVSENGTPLVTSETLFEGHSLDIVMLAASPRGVVVSVGLDRRIVVWKLKTRWQSASKDILRPTCTEHVLWPVMAIALDERGEWLAVATRAGMVSFWQVKEAAFYRSISIDLEGHHPSAFFFEPRIDDDPQHGPRVVILRQDGWLFEIGVWTGGITHHRICDGVAVSSSHGVLTPRLPLRVVTACQRGRIFVTAKIAGTGEWRTEQLTFNNPSLEKSIDTGEACTILPLSALGMIISSKSCRVDLVDLLSGGVIRTFQTGQFKPSSLRAFHAKQRTCLYCGCPAVLSFSIAYSERDSGMFIMHTFYSTRGNMRDICLRVERDRRERKCSGFENVNEKVHWLENVEGWEPTNLNMVAGIRRRELSQEDQSSDDQASFQSSSLRRRGKANKKQSSEDEDEWESWTMQADGVVNTYPIHDKNADMSDDGLLVSRAGPVSKVGQRSVAVGFGNTVKILSVGNERYEDNDDDYLYHTMHRGKKNHYHRIK
ncbi:hypothetical protein RUND412_000648 [Rhizina undulata]